MDDTKYLPAFQLIEHAGDAESEFMLAMEAAEAGQFAQAEENYQKGCAALKEAHCMQTDMMKQEAEGSPIDINIIMVHAQDHLSMALQMKCQAQQVVSLCKRISALEEAVKAMGH